MRAIGRRCVQVAVEAGAGKLHGFRRIGREVGGERALQFLGAERAGAGARYRDAYAAAGLSRPGGGN